MFKRRKIAKSHYILCLTTENDAIKLCLNAIFNQLPGVLGKILTPYRSSIATPSPVVLFGF